MASPKPVRGRLPEKTTAIPEGRRMLVFGLLALLLPTSLAQAPPEVAGLPQDIEATGDTTEFEALAGWVRANWQTHPGQARDVAERALDLARDLDDQRRVGESLMMQGNLAFSSEPRRAEEYYLEARTAFEQAGFDPGVISIQQNLASIYGRRGEVEQALAAFFDALEHAERVGDTERRVGILNNIGIIHDGQGNLEEASRFYEQAITLAETLNDPGRLVNPLNNYGIVLGKLGSFEKAESQFQRALAISQEQGTRRATAMTSANLGDLFNQQNRHQHALPFLQTAERLSEELGDDGFLVDVYDELAKVYIGLGAFERALPYANKSLTLAIKLESFSAQMVAHETLSQIHKATGNIEQALLHHEHYVTARDSVFNAEKAEIVSEMQARYESEEKQRAIESLEQERHIQSLQASRRQNLLLAGVGGLLLLLGFLFSRFRLKQKANRLLEARKQEVQEKSRLLQENKVELQESLKEKELLVKEIHHRVKNNLQVITSLLNTQQRTIANPTARAAIQEAYQRVRSMALIHQGLYRRAKPAHLDIQEYIETLSRRLLRAADERDRSVNCSVDADGILLHADTAVPLGLIVTELISNSLKHAFPGRRSGEIRVDLVQDGDAYVLEVGDDGVGLPSTFRTERATMGITLVENMTRQLGGTLQIDNGVGVTYRIRFKGGEAL